jgi:hypothetical protein
MSKLYAFLSLLIILSAFALQAQPKIEFEGGNSFDFGDVLMENSPYPATIKIKNIGTEELKIFDLEKDCGCTWAPLEKNLIPPGDFAEVNIRQTFAIPGNITKVLTFKTNDPDNQTINFYLYAKASSQSTVNALTIDLKEVALNTEGKASVVLKNDGDFDVRIIKIKQGNAQIKLNIKDGALIPKKGSITIEAAFSPVNIGEFSDTIHLMTNDRNMGKVTIYVVGRGIKKG